MAWKHVYGEQHLKRGLYINKILYGVIDLPLWVFNPIANSPCRTRGRAWDALVADPNLLTFFTRPTPNRLVVRFSRVWPCRTGEPEGSGPRVSPSRYKEVILLPSRHWPGSGARLLAIRRSDGVAKAAGPGVGPTQPTAVPSTTAPRPSRGQHPHRSEAGGRGHPGEGAPAPFTWPHRASPPARPELSPRKAAHHRRKGVIPSTVADQGSFHRGEAGTTRAGRQPAAREPPPPRREARSASRRCGAGQRQSLSSPPVVSQSAGRSHRRRSRRAPRPLKKSARARLAAEGKLGPLTPAVEIRE